MRYRVQHETVYKYDSPVALSQQLLHLAPRELAYQRCDKHRLSIAPEPTETTTREDYFGNPVTQVLLAVAHGSLTVRADSEITILPRPAAAAGESWEAVRDQLRSGASKAAVVTAALPLDALQHAFESPHIECFRDLASYANASFARGRPIVEASLDLARRIHADFTFDGKATSVSTPLREVLSRRRGVCQDFAHLMIGCLRTLGLAARYVSGYILTNPPPGQPRLVGADASHAWVSVWCGAAGWVDMDPTNNCLVREQHVTLAWGRDFSDVTPMRGVILGGGDQALEVRVTVMPLAA
jgi:transglutaminase-like putative cysteine protease